MIPQYKDYEAFKEKAKYSGQRLPVGAYVCKILGIKFEPGKAGNSDMLIVQFDVAEGEYADFFKKQYEESTQDNKRFKGRTTVYLPKDDGSEQDGWTKTAFSKWINALEESNEGYHWDWNENTWKNKKLGLVFGETGTRIEGKDVIYTECRFPVSVEAVRSGKVPEAKFKAKGDYGKEGSDGSTDFMNIPDEIQEELPFK